MVVNDLDAVDVEENIRRGHELAWLLRRSCVKSIRLLLSLENSTLYSSENPLQGSRSLISLGLQQRRKPLVFPSRTPRNRLRRAAGVAPKGGRDLWSRRGGCQD
jgi:hypothetical protein